MDINFSKSNTNVLCLPSQSKMNKINALLTELLEKKAHLIEANYIIKFYKECDSNICREDVLTKIKAIIKTNEMQKAVKIKDKTGKVSSTLFHLSDSEISAFYGNPVLDLNEKQYVNDKVIGHIISAFKNDYFNSDVPKEFLGESNKVPSCLDKKMKIFELLNELQSKVNISQDLLTSIENNLQQLLVIRRNNDVIKNTDNIYFINEEQALTLKARMLELNAEKEIINENKDILKAMDMLQIEFEKCIFEKTLKLRELEETLEECNKNADNKEFQELLKICQKIQKSIEQNENFLKMLEN